MRDVGGGGDLAVGESEPAGAADGVLIFAVGFALAAWRARYLPEHVCAELLSGALLAVAFGVGDRAEAAGGDRGAGGLGARVRTATNSSSNGARTDLAQR